ncbi:STAS/SEC14 domain-containing protein [Pelagicoccus sp. SDUM812002]|uniref:STAS/SEC14 domain-containing protein n=1 Tax=Pelagicoccus sp. SDUM812002 TaxID=3041266 RepID=UPI00280E8A9E|nr:STAS/SEC14 domain-containing protein [Pelagicoccus sp. SDUM812002]MDQ8186801.1 STAS/SEC14 domain-containing protein [Pelagicoccus sp. SDUM812002]
MSALHGQTVTQCPQLTQDDSLIGLPPSHRTRGCSDVQSMLKVSVTIRISACDCDEYVSMLKERISQHGKISLYCEMIDFDGWTPAGLWADTKFDVTHANDFTRIAFAADSKWVDLITQAMKPISSAQFKHFALAEREEALSWAKGQKG